MSKDNNLHDYLSDLADAIREKKGTTEPINAQSFAEEIRTIEGGAPEGYEPFFAVDEGYFVQGESNGFKSKYTGEQIDTLLDMVNGSAWTGHADVEGLKAIGWDDEDIAYYQKYGVNWNEEDDEYHKVSDDNKALYGILTADNIKEYNDRIVYLPKIDVSKLQSALSFLNGANCLIATPNLNFRNASNTAQMFNTCRSLACIHPFEAPNNRNMQNMFSECYHLAFIPPLDLSEVTSMYQAFGLCFNLTSIDLSNSSKVTTFNKAFLNCYSIMSISLDLKSATSIENAFSNCYSIVKAFLKNAAVSIQLGQSQFINKESLLYIINNEAATTAITITLHSTAYSRLSTDYDVIAALANHPNINLASA